MPRTGTKKRVAQIPALKQYLKLNHADKFILWHYYLYQKTDGKEGWNPKQPGSVYHQRSSNYLLSLGSQSWFRHRGQSMVKLLDLFNQEGEEVPEVDSTPPANEQSFVSPATKKKGNTLHDQARRRIGKSPAETTPSQEESSPTMPNPTPYRMPRKGNTGAPVYAPDVDEDGMELLKAPMCYGIHKEFDYKSRSTTTKILIKMLPHGGLTDGEIEWDWITPRQLKLRVPWPLWFQNAEEMALFILDDEGNMIFPPDHPITMDTAERNASRVEEDGRIWEVCMLKFMQDMVTDEDSMLVELLDARPPGTGDKCKVIQIYAVCAKMQEAPSSSNKKTAKARNVEIGAAPKRGVTRLRQENDDDDDDMNAE